MSTVVEVEGGYEIHMQTGITVEVNNASGSSGTNGVGIENIEYNGEEIVIEMTDETTYGPFQVRGLQGEQGPQGEMGFMGPTGPTGPQGPAGTTDHSLLLNLNADDHTQYLNLNGRAGGQTVRGGTATGENLTLMSTNHATKGSILFGDSRYNEATNRLILGAATGTGRINLPDAGTTSADGIQFGTGLSLYRSSQTVLAFSGTELAMVGGAYMRTPQIYDITSYTKSISLNYNDIRLSAPAGVSIIPPSLTGSSSTPALSISQTWNTTGTPSAIFLNITNTASGASSRLVDLRVGNVSQFNISRTGAVESLYQRFGSGSPEGVVTAPVGAIYHRTDGGANTSLYVKESGTGNTGWIAK